MSRRKDPAWKQERKRRNRNENTFATEYDAQAVHTASQKQKARDLRKSSWWKNKIADGICYYCEKKFSPEDLTMDHKIPISRGGESIKENLVPACKECNNKKKYLLPTEWDEYISRLKGD